MTGSPCGSSQFLLVFGLLSSSSGCVSSERSRLLPGFRPCLCLLGFFSLTLTFLSSSETCLRVLYLFSTLPWLHTVPCWLTSLASALLCFPLISPFLFFFGSVISSVFSLSLVFLLGVSCGFLPSLGFYLSSLSLPAPCGFPTHGSFSGGICLCSPVGCATGSVLLGSFFQCGSFLSLTYWLGCRWRSPPFCCLVPFGFGHSGLCGGSSLCAPLLPCASSPAFWFRSLELSSHPRLWFVSPRPPSCSPPTTLRSFPLSGFSGLFLCSFSSSSFLLFFFGGGGQGLLLFLLLVRYLWSFCFSCIGLG